MKKRWALLVAALAVLLCLSGCTTALHHQFLIHGFGIDKAGDDYLVTVRYAPMDGKKQEELVQVKGKTVFDALNDLSLTTGKKQLYATAGYIVVGKELAEAGLDAALDFFIRYFKTRPTIALYMAAGKAADILGMKAEGEYIPSKAILAYTGNRENRGKTTAQTVMGFINDVKSRGVSAVVPVIENVEGKLSCRTSAVFDGYRLDCQLDRGQTVGYLAGKGGLSGASLVVKDAEGKEFTADITRTSAKIRHSVGPGGPAFSVEVSAKAVLASYPLAGRGSDYQALEQALSRQLQGYVSAALEESLGAKADILGLGYRLYVRSPNSWRPLEAQWRDLLPDLPVKVTVKSRITRLGQEEAPPM